MSEDFFTKYLFILVISGDLKSQLSFLAKADFTRFLPRLLSKTLCDLEAAHFGELGEPVFKNYNDHIYYSSSKGLKLTKENNKEVKDEVVERVKKVLLPYLSNVRVDICFK